MDDNARTTPAPVGTGAPVVSGIPDVDAAAKAQQQQQQQQPSRPRVDDDDNNDDGTSNTHNNNTIKESTMKEKEKNNTKRSRPSPLSFLPQRDSKRTATTAAAAAATSNHNRSNKWELSPISLLLRTMGYMDNTTLMIMCLVCKQIKELIWKGDGMETNLIRIFEVRPSEDEHYIDWYMFLANINRYCQDSTKHRMLQGYHHWKIYHSEKSRPFLPPEVLERLVSPHVRMMGIVDLDMSSPVPILMMEWFKLFNLLMLLVPNLRKLNISNISLHPDILMQLPQRCPHLEVIKWNNNDGLFFFADGRQFKSIKNLKELHLDRRTFFFPAKIDEDADDSDDDTDADTGDDDDDADDDVSEDKAMTDMKNHPDIFLFYKLCKNNPIERVSIRHAQWEVSHSNLDPEFTTQNILIKLVRKAPPSLVWFRSDLSTANIRMLQLERPGIHCVN